MHGVASHGDAHGTASGMAGWCKARTFASATAPVSEKRMISPPPGWSTRAAATSASTIVSVRCGTLTEDM